MIAKSRGSRMKYKYRTPLPTHLSFEDENLVNNYIGETFPLRFEVKNSDIYTVRKLKAKEYYRIMGYCDAILEFVRES